METIQNTEITVRAIGPEDTKNISLILALSWKTAYRGVIDDRYLDALSVDRWVPLIEKTIAGEWADTHYFGAEKEGSLIGAACLKEPRGHDTAELIALYLLPQEIGQGIGHQFYTELENRIRTGGYAAIKLDVLVDNIRARRFYERRGFRNEGEAVIELGGRKYAYIMMKKILI